jgi:hypothetical protein
LIMQLPRQRDLFSSFHDSATSSVPPFAPLARREQVTARCGPHQVGLGTRLTGTPPCPALVRRDFLDFLDEVVKRLVVR